MFFLQKFLGARRNGQEKALLKNVTEPHIVAIFMQRACRVSFPITLFYDLDDGCRYHHDDVRLLPKEQQLA